MLLIFHVNTCFRFSFHRAHTIQRNLEIVENSGKLFWAEYWCEKKVISPKTWKTVEPAITVICYAPSLLVEIEKLLLVKNYPRKHSGIVFFSANELESCLILDKHREVVLKLFWPYVSDKLHVFPIFTCKNREN